MLISAKPEQDAGPLRPIQPKGAEIWTSPLDTFTSALHYLHNMSMAAAEFICYGA